MTELDTVAITWVINDGGRAAAGFKGRAPSDSVVRAIAIAEGLTYREVYDELTRRQENWAFSSRSATARKKSKTWGAASARLGVVKAVYMPYLMSRGWRWVSVMKVGSGVTMHLSWEEIPEEPVFIAQVSGGLVTVINGVVHDIEDPSRDGTRAIYGYFRRD